MDKAYPRQKSNDFPPTILESNFSIHPDPSDKRMWIEWIGPSSMDARTEQAYQQRIAVSTATAGGSE
ncbi:MAG: hypothetical protein M1472_05090 [Planctomycetes bacterium]|jgi:hypothetical protein|nr:hypothetical protein [Planctomycetota bacterium]